jgi:uncharacterized protein DUF4236/SH3 domain-containing protein
MGYFRFRRSIKILPGVRWNIGKKSTSVSLGGRGLTYTIGTKGSRTTVGIPGTGLSYTQIHSHSKPGSAVPPPPLPSSVPSSQVPTKSNASKFFYVFGMILLVIWLLGKLSEQSSSHSSVGYPASSPAASASPSFILRTTPIPSYSRNRTYSTTLDVSPIPTYSATASDSPAIIRRALPVAPSAYSSQSLTAASAPASGQSLQASPTEYAPSYRVVKINQRDTLNLRAGPGSSYPIIAYIRPDARGITLGTGRSANGPTIWQQISVGGHTGWVNEIFIEPEVSAH